MSNTNGLDEVNRKIEQLVSEYLAATRAAFVAAAQRAFEAPVVAARNVKSSTSAGARVSRRASGRRRAPEEVAQLGARLLELVRARPGEAMVVFATELGTTARELHRPMTLLKRTGQIRSVGQRHQARYFPAVGNKATAATR